MSPTELHLAEIERLKARVAELEGQLARAPIDRASLYKLTDAAPWGALVVGRDGAIDYANPAFQRWLLLPAPATGTEPRAAVHPPMLATLEAPIAAALGGESTTLETRLLDVADGLRILRIHVAPRASGDAGVTGAVVSVYDLTQTEANEAWLARINAVTPSAMYVMDVVRGVPIWGGGRTGSITGMSLEEVNDSGTPPRQMVHPDDVPRIGQRMRDLARLPDGEVVELEMRVRRADGTWRWVLDRAVVFERDPNGRITKTLSAAVDIDERKHAEERRTILINELNHRVKNTLAAVQLIARQTLRRGRPVELAEELFTARLVALSAAHNILTRENWVGASLRQVVDEALQPFEPPGSDRITVHGPDVRVSARAALALAMALHELATNAAKYGALSAEAGAVRLTWQVRQGGVTPLLDLEWAESGGPPVAPPTSLGFGSRLLTQGLAADLTEAAKLDFRPSGLVCRITAPIEPTLHMNLGATPGGG